MKVVAVIQARMSSSRFPGKVLAPLHGLPMIAFMLRRLSSARHVDQVVVATSDDASDEPLATCVESFGHVCHRGPLDDVLARFHQAASRAEADIVIRLTGDCPLLDADLVDRVVLALQAAPEAVYASNVAPPTFPDGLDVEAFRFAALDHAHAAATLNSDREHVTPYIRRAAKGGRAVEVRGVGDMSHLRWTVDYPDDLRFVAGLLEATGMRDPVSMDRFDFYRALEQHPHLLSINQHERNEGLQKSLLADNAATL